MTARQLLQYSTYSYTALRKCLPILGYDCKEYQDIGFDEIKSFAERGMVPIVKLVGDSVVVIVGGDHNNSDEPYLKAVCGDQVYELYSSDISNTSAIVVSGISHSGQANIIFERDKAIPSGYAEHIIELRHIIDNCHIPRWMVPKIPILISFGEKVINETGLIIRGESHGPNVIVRDIQDPVTVLLHEIGHVYHDTILNTEEIHGLSSLFMKVDQVSPNGLFRSTYEASTEREYFSTIYMWYLKGIMLAEQYRYILNQIDPEAFKFLENVFERCRQDMLNQSVYNALKPKIESFILNGKMELMKAGKRYTGNAQFIDRVKPMFPYKTLVKSDNREWIVATDGALRGKVIVLNKGDIDFKYMRRDKYYMTPRRTFVLTKAGGEYRSVNKNPYLDLVPVALGQWNNDGEKLLLKSEFYKDIENGENEINVIYEQSKFDMSGALGMYQSMIAEAEFILDKAECEDISKKITVLFRRKRIEDAKNILNKLQQEKSNV